MGLKNDKFLQDAFAEHYSHSGNISKTCKEVGVGRDTVYRLIDCSPDFAEKIETARTKYLEEMAESFKEHAPEALEALMGVIRDKDAPKTAVVAAASKIIDYSKDWTEAANMEKRIADLQNEINEAERGLA